MAADEAGCIDGGHTTEDLEARAKKFGNRDLPRVFNQERNLVRPLFGENNSGHSMKEDRSGAETVRSNMASRVHHTEAEVGVWRVK